MKRLIVVIVLALVAISAIYVKAQYFWRGEFMGVEKVCQRWGEKPLEIARFKSADEDESIRSQMTCSLLKNQQEYVGKDRSEIRDLFGSYTGYYFSDMFPTYLIEIAETDEQDSWQIVFLINKKEKISKIVVHKNCCNR